MKRIITIVAVLVILLLFAAGIRFLQISPYPMGGGRYVESPDKRFTAHASSLTDRHFFCGDRRYYEFTIESGPRQQVRRLVIDEPTEGMIGWREEGRIEWAADSSMVTYSFKDVQVTLSVVP